MYPQATLEGTPEAPSSGEAATGFALNAGNLYIYLGLWFISIMSAANRTRPTIATILLMIDSIMDSSPSSGH